MKKGFTLIVFFFSFLTGKSQCASLDTNLVLNPSFEDTVSCPIGIGCLNCAQSWFNPTMNSPDYFNSCSPVWSSGANVPYNFWGTQNARNGNGYGGFAVELNSSSCNREYIAGNLFQNLTAGLNYYFEMWVSLSDSSLRAVNKIGVYFSNSNPSIPLDTNGNPNYGCLPYNANITWDTVVKDTVNWVRLNGNFIANGGEHFFVIGDFLPNDSLRVDTMNYNYPNIGGLAYYYVDDVKVCHCDSLSDTSQHPVYPVFSISPNPSGGNFQLTGNFPLNSQLHIYNLLGQEIQDPISLPEGNRQVPICLNLAQGVYIYRVQLKNDILHEEKLVIMK